MPTVDIKTDYGAVGDGQIATVNATFNSASNSLTVFTQIFAAGDITKFICVSGWLTAVGSNGANPAGGQGSAAVTANGTINSISAAWNGTSMTVVLGGPAASRSISSVATQIEWGSDDRPAFEAFNTAQTGQSNVTLTIPSGRYLLVTGTGGGGASLPIGQTIATLNVTVSGSPTLSDMLGGGAGPTLNFNGAPLYNDNTAESLIQTVSAGSTVLSMVTIADASKYTANTWAWMTGYDTQGFGSPPNPQFGEFVKITAVNAGAGTVTINSPLRYSYKSTWPKWGFGTPGSGAPNYTGGSFSLGGPATLYLIQSALWDVDHTWDGVNFRATPTLQNMGGRNMTVKNSTFESFGPNVSFQRDCTFDNIVVPTQWELDKDTDYLTVSNSTISGFFGPQSPSPFNVTLNNVTVTNQFPATGANYTIINCTLPTDVQFGPNAYGAPTSVSVSGTSFAGQLLLGGVKEVDINTTGAYSCSNGLITRLKAGGTGAPPQWAFPGLYFFLGSRYNYENAAWKVLDVYDDGTTLYIQTNQSTGFPTPVSGSAISAITAPPLISFSGCTGSDDAVSWSNVTANRIQFSQWNKTYSGNIGAASAAHQIKIAGQVVSIRITVAAGYSAGTLNLNGPFVIAKPGNTEATWSPVIDLTTTGVRTITPAGANSLGSDSGLALPNSGNVWLVDNQITPAMSGAVGAGSATIEISANLGFGLGTVGLIGLRR